MLLLLLCGAILGVALAKPSLDTELIARMKRSPPSNNTESIDVNPEEETSTILTVLKGTIGFELIPDGHIDFSTPVNAIEVGANIATELEAYMEATHVRAAHADECFADLSVNESATDILERFEKLEEIIHEQEDHGGKVQAMIRLKTIQAALAGTTGDTQNENGCDFDGGLDDPVRCIVNKMYMISVATERMATDLTAFYSNEIPQCTQALEGAENGNSAGELGLALQSATVCLTNNFDVLRNHVTGDKFFPTSIPDLFIPRALGATVLINGVRGVVWWNLYSQYILEQKLREIAGLPEVNKIGALDEGFALSLFAQRSSPQASSGSK